MREKIDILLRLNCFSFLLRCISLLLAVFTARVRHRDLFIAFGAEGTTPGERLVTVYHQ